MSEENGGSTFTGGSVLLSRVVDEDGKVVKGLRAGFDQKAMEAVQKWRWKPVRTEVCPSNFRCTSK